MCEVVDEASHGCVRVRFGVMQAGKCGWEWVRLGVRGLILSP